MSNLGAVEGSIGPGHGRVLHQQVLGLSEPGKLGGTGHRGFHEGKVSGITLAAIVEETPPGSAHLNLVNNPRRDPSDFSAVDGTITTIVRYPEVLAITQSIEHPVKRAGASPGEHPAKTQHKDGVNELPELSLCLYQDAPELITGIDSVALAVGSVEVPGKNPGTGQQQVVAVQTSSTVPQPLTAFYIGGLQRIYTIYQTDQTGVEDEVRVGIFKKLLRMALPGPARRLQGHGNQLVALKWRDECPQRIAYRGIRSKQQNTQGGFKTLSAEQAQNGISSSTGSKPPPPG